MPTEQTHHKTTFIMNALENGWTVKKIQNSYVFTKKHENWREIFQEDYLETFIQKNLSTPFVFV